jgi:CheY-like chemotaxis protein
VGEALEHGASSVEIMASEGKGRYQFTTSKGQSAVGSIQPAALEKVLVHLNSFQGDVFPHPSVGNVLVRSLAGASHVRLSWKVETRDTSNPRAIEWVAQVEREESAARSSMTTTASTVPEDGVADLKIPVLIVDDNPMFCRILERVLRRENCEVSVAEHGEAALESLTRLTSFSPKVIICDLHMPRMNGKEFVSKVRSDMRLKGIPIVMLTSDEAADVEVSVLEIGADAVVSKSKDPRVLCAQVMRLAKIGGLQEAA